MTMHTASDQNQNHQHHQPQATHIYLVRHGQASFGHENYDQLSPKGIIQSNLLGQWFEQIQMPISKVYIGQALRHQQTFTHCLEHLNHLSHMSMQMQPNILSGFNEFDHQEVIARSPELSHIDFTDPAAMAKAIKAYAMDTKSSPPNQEDPSTTAMRSFQALFGQAFSRWISDQYKHEYQQSWLGFQQNSQLAMAQVLQEAAAAPSSAQTILIFTSAGTISSILQPLLGIDDQQLFGLMLGLCNTGVTKLTHQHQQTRVDYINSQAHFEFGQQADLISYL